MSKVTVYTISPECFDTRGCESHWSRLCRTKKFFGDFSAHFAKLIQLTHLLTKSHHLTKSPNGVDLGRLKSHLYNMYTEKSTEISIDNSAICRWLIRFVFSTYVWYLYVFGRILCRARHAVPVYDNRIITSKTAIIRLPPNAGLWEIEKENIPKMQRLQ